MNEINVIDKGETLDVRIKGTSQDLLKMTTSLVGAMCEQIKISPVNFLNLVLNGVEENVEDKFLLSKLETGVYATRCNGELAIEMLGDNSDILFCLVGSLAVFCNREGIDPTDLVRFIDQEIRNFNVSGGGMVS